SSFLRLRRRNGPGKSLPAPSSRARSHTGAVDPPTPAKGNRGLRANHGIQLAAGGYFQRCRERARHGGVEFRSRPIRHGNVLQGDPVRKGHIVLRDRNKYGPREIRPNPATRQTPSDRRDTISRVAAPASPAAQVPLAPRAGTKARNGRLVRKSDVSARPGTASG